MLADCASLSAAETLNGMMGAGRVRAADVFVGRAKDGRFSFGDAFSLPAGGGRVGRGPRKISMFVRTCRTLLAAAAISWEFCDCWSAAEDVKV